MEEKYTKEKEEIFSDNINSTLNVKRDFQNMQYDFEWIEKIEDTLPYIDNILRNPKRFIVNDEEIVKVELARKTTVESIIHLTQHTNFIQDIDEENGDVKPSKILNINKDESLDTYENRFIFTLINNLRIFFDNRCQLSGKTSFYKDKKLLNYTANTAVGEENIKINIEVESIAESEKVITSKDGLTIDERLKKIKQQLDGFTQTELFKTLNKLHVAPVRSPIRKTNVILKNPNFQQSEKLWNYIQTFQSKDKVEKINKNYLDNAFLKEEYNNAFKMIYTYNQLVTTDDNETYNKVITDMIDRFIENIIESEVITEEELKVKFTKELEKIKINNHKKLKNIYNIIEDRFQRENKIYLEKEKLLEGE